MRAILAGVILLWCVSAQALHAGTTFYVSKDGDDRRRCTNPESPCETLARAASLAVHPGDIVQAGPGVYRERLRIQTGGSEEEPIVFRGHDGGGCPVDKIEDDPNSRGERPAPTVEMDGFRIEASHLRFECFKVVGTDLLTIEINSAFAIRKGVQHVEIVDNFVDGSETPGRPWAGVSLQTNLPHEDMAGHIRVARNYIRRTNFGFMIVCKEDCLFEDNEVERTQADERVGDSDYTRVFGEKITLRGNYFHGNLATDCPRCHFDCFQTYNTGRGLPDHFARHVLIENNTCFGAHEAIIIRDGDGKNPDKMDKFQSHRDWVVRNNVFGYGPGIPNMSWCALFEHVGDVVFEHNLCVQAGVTGYLNGTNAVHRYNIHFENGASAYSSAISGYRPGNVVAESNLLFRTVRSYLPSQNAATDRLNMNPQFQDPEKRDFRLTSGSPARNGAFGSSLKTDRLQLRRPQDGIADIGPFEYPGEAPPPDEEVDPPAPGAASRRRATGASVPRSLPSSWPKKDAPPGKRK